jgi:teichoic acid transport system ATP-binding protein
VTGFRLENAVRVDPAAPSPVTVPPPAIEVDHLSASYRVRLEGKNMLADLRKLVSRRSSERLIPALRDVSFTVPRGSVLGIIGRNGAGKSTLLRTIAGILAPEEGRVVVRGRVNLLAIGIGFNDNLTGRQNIKLGGLAVGLDPHRLAALSDEIAEFAQLDEYIDFPIRAYSSGMRSRLGFAVAAHLDPEILLIDEALTGGDAAYQQHAGEKMAELCGEGRTIVLVSHGLSSIRTMATEAMWLHQGRVAAVGDPDDVVAQYMRYCRLESLSPDWDHQ